MVTISQSLLNEITAYCMQKAPYEACGTLHGCDNGTGHISVVSFQVINNIAANPLHDFLLDPYSFIPQLLAGDSQLVGIFHSHPTTHAYPSPADSCLEWRFPTYWIISLAIENSPSVKSYARTLSGWQDQQLRLY